LDNWKDINHQMHQFGAIGQKQADCRLCWDATYPMQNIGIIWIAPYGWEALDLLNPPGGITCLRVKPAENSDRSKSGSTACTVRKNVLVLPILHDLTQIILDALKGKIMRIENIKYQT